MNSAVRPCAWITVAPTMLRVRGTRSGRTRGRASFSPTRAELVVRQPDVGVVAARQPGRDDRVDVEQLALGARARLGDAEVLRVHLAADRQPVGGPWPGVW